jgi:hypothetical protein
MKVSGERIVPSSDTASSPQPSLSRPLRRRPLSGCLAVLGLAFFCYVLGAGAMFFELPSSAFLSKAFLGAQAWNERRQLPPPVAEEQKPPIAIGAIDVPSKTFDGFTLYTCASLSAPSTQAYLMNMRGDTVHRWSLPYSRIASKAPDRAKPEAESHVCFFGCHLYPNGDLLAIFQGTQPGISGFGLAKLDKDSNLLWTYHGNVHHDVDVDEDGTIYALTHRLVHDMPAGLKHVPTPSIVDYLVLLSPQGKELGKPIALLEALRDSPYAPMLEALGDSNKPELTSGLTLHEALERDRRREPLHANTVKVLRRNQAPRFPDFKAGQVLLTFRNLDAIAVLDPRTRAMVWAARGPWQGPHDAQFLDNGCLLIYDNLGSNHSTRVLEYDPRTQAMPWSYPERHHPPFLSMERGMGQRLPNGNTLIVNSQGGEIWEVTADRQVVWNCTTGGYVPFARRYAPEQLPFLKGDARARPN